MSPALVERVTREVLQPAVDAMAAQGTPYVGVLYAGLMLSAPEAGDAPGRRGGFKVLEFNCRFGDPEAQVILPLLETDLVEVLEACIEGRLAETEVQWRAAHATCVVMASGGYPGAYERGKPISGLDAAGMLPGVTVFHAGTRRDGGSVVTNGGRVLGVTALAPALPTSIERAYAGVAEIGFEGAMYRTDIGAKALAE
jgi:phosphoribosylamine--glycine ligase